MDEAVTWHGGRPQPRRLCVRWGSSPTPQKGAALPNFWPISIVTKRLHPYQDATWYGCRPQPRRLRVRWRPSPLSKRGQSPPLEFSVHVYCGQTAGWINIALGMEVGLGPVHIVLDGDTAPLPKKGGRAPTPFSAHLYCGQTAGCIKVPLGMEVGLSLGDCVRWGPIPYPKRGAAPLNFRPSSIVAKRLHGSRCHLVLR